jgi:acylphosphatase
MSDQPGVERRTVLYSGHVQGVGFRWTAVRIADGFDIRGYVRNLDDGRVELVAEGVIEELDQFLAAVAKGLDGYIGRFESSASRATHEFSSFTIRY